MSSTRREKLHALLSSDPSDAFTRYALALEYASAGDVGKAMSLFEELLQIQPDYSPAYHQLGILCERQGDTQRAERIYAQGIAVARKAGDVHAAKEMQDALDLLS